MEVLTVDSIKTRMQAYKYNSIPQCVLDTHKNEGMAGFFRGIPVSSLSVPSPFVRLYLTVYLLDKNNVRSERPFILHHPRPHNILLNLRILKTLLRHSPASSTLQSPSPAPKPIPSNLPHNPSLPRFLHDQRRNGLPRRLHFRSLHHRHGMSL